MSLHKRVKGDFTIESIDTGDFIKLESAGGITIAGDLTVTGDTTSVNTTDLDIIDNTIILNSGETGPGITHPDGSAGISVDRGDGITAGQESVGIRYAESMEFNAQPGWEATDDGTTWYPVSTVAGGFNLVDDTTPQLGGNLDVNGFSITSAAAGDIVIVADTTGLVKIDQDLSLLEQGTDESALAGYNKIYAKVPGAGGTGLYVVNSTNTVPEELVSKTQAIIYGIIF